MTDYISRQALLKDIEKYHVSDGKFQHWVEIQPSAPVREVKRGRWIPVTNGRGGFECDKCYNYAPSFQDGVEWLSDFCPTCGADMREEE